MKSITLYYSSFSWQRYFIITDDVVFDFNGTSESSEDYSPEDLSSVMGNKARKISFEILTVEKRDNVPIIAIGSCSHFGAFQIMHNKDGIIGLNAWTGEYSSILTGKKINDNTWHNVVVTYDGNTLRIFVDGLPDSESKTWDNGAFLRNTMNTQGKTIFLGKKLVLDDDLTNFPMKGKLRNVRFYNFEVSKIAIRG